MFHIAKLILMPENYEIPTLSSRNLPNIQVEKEKIIFEIKPLEILKIIHFDINTSTGRLFINRDTFNTKLGCIFSFLF